MKTPPKAQSATSLPRAPRDDEARRSSRYLVMMGIRIACFILMVVITPYGWYTWVFGAAAIVLPYIAVVLANEAADVREATAEHPERALTATPTTNSTTSEAGSPVLRIEETRAIEPTPETSDDRA